MWEGPGGCGGALKRSREALEDVGRAWRSWGGPR